MKLSLSGFLSFAHKNVIFERVPLEMFKHDDDSRFYAGDDKVLLPRR